MATYKSQFLRLKTLWLPTIIVLTCLRVWIEPGPILPLAHAQIPDSGLQRKQLLEETRRTNLLLEQMIDILKVQGVKLRLPTTDNSTDTGRGAASRGRK